ncbi:MAG: YwaF family protein [Oscillospiraceae bacterium]|nr:YwaF family protein [Oscillospiraceae bacterium]
MKEFFGFGGYTRPAEGFLSWQHLLFVGSLLIVMALLAIWLGKNRKHRTDREKNRVLIAAALLIDGFELMKIIVLCLRSESTEPILRNLPLFLCSIQLIAIPMAAFTKGRVREASLDFVCIFGILGAVFGTIGAGQNYNAYPVLSMDNVVSGITHCISGFASLYIMIAGMAGLKKENIGFTFGILVVSCVAAYIANITIPYNYMFLMAGDGTPYDILYNLVNGNKVFYPLLVVALFLIYIVLFYRAARFVSRKKQRAEETVK